MCVCVCVCVNRPQISKLTVFLYVYFYLKQR